MSSHKSDRRIKIKKRVRASLFGTADKPRFTVYRSNLGIYAQLVNDEKKITVVSASYKEVSNKGTKTELAFAVGKSLAEKAVSQGITQVIFDRNGFLYHGRVKALADGAREGGLKF